MVTQNYTISTVKNSVPPKVKMSQYDSASRTITFTVVDASGAEVDLTGKTVTVEGTRIDGHAFASECTVSEATATFTETVDMTNQAGDHPAELVVRENGQRLGTMNFVISVEPAAMDEDASITEEDQSLFEQLYGVGDAALSAAETLYQHILDNASAPIIYNTASGAVASFSDGADDYPIKGLTVAVEPVQSGSGDPSPSNVRPISGFSEVKVTRTGKNLLNNTAQSRTINGITFTVNADGTVTANGTATEAAELTITQNFNGLSGSVLLNGNPSGSSGSTYRMRYRATNDGVGSSWVYCNAAIDYDVEFSRVTNFELRLAVQSGQTVNNLVFAPMIRLASDADATYEPYQGETYTISLGETVYGGTLDVVGGKMVVDRAKIVFDGTEAWRQGSDVSTFFVFTLGDANRAEMQNSVARWFCNAFTPRRYVTSLNLPSGSVDCFAGTYGTTLGFKYDATDTLAEWKDYVASLNNNGTPLTVVYILATPIEISLTPTQINTLRGGNNVYSSAGDIQNCEYPCDTKRFILNSIASALA